MITKKTILLFAFLSIWVRAPAQTVAPSPEQMIEQLKLPKTRGLRNLSVEAVTEKSGTVKSEESPRPSLSLMIQFDFNSARIKPESQQALANLSQALQSVDLINSRFSVEGHTDAKGGVDYNQKLSYMRAQAVREFMKTRGVDQDRLLAEGKGFSDLVNVVDPMAAENRRVRIVNLD